MEDINEAPRNISKYIHVIPLKPRTARLEIADWQIEFESSEESPEGHYRDKLIFLFIYLLSFFLFLRNKKTDGEAEGVKLTCCEWT